jgi:hypothetical protein
MLKPLIDVVLSFFILATLAGEVISFAIFPEDGLSDLAQTTLTDGALKTLYILWTFGFLAGFSERFAWDFVNRAEGTVSGSKGGNGAGNGGNSGNNGGNGNAGGKAT